MKPRTLRLGCTLVCVFVLFACGGAAGTTALLRYPSSASPELYVVQTYAGPVELKASLVHPAPSITLVLLLDSLSAEALDTTRKELPELLATLRGRPLRIMALRNGALESVGSFTSRAQLQAALAKLQPIPDTSSPTSPSTSIDALLAATSQLGTGWSQVFLVGELPALDPLTVDYASAVLLRAFSGQHIRVSWFAPGEGSDAWLPLFRSSGGGIITGKLGQLLAHEDSTQQYIQLDWDTRSPASGFVVYRSTMSDGPQHMVFEVPEVVVPPGASLPSVERYSEMQARTAEAAALLKQDSLTSADALRVRDHLQASLEVNPRDPATLLTIVDFYEKYKNYQDAAKFCGYLVEVRPVDGGAYAALGHALTLAVDIDRAESALQRASDLGSRTPRVVEDFARVHLARKDDRGALPYLEEALRADAKRQDLWFLQGQAAERSHNSELAVRSFEQGLSLGGIHVPESGSLVRLYVSKRNKEKAIELSRHVIANFPPDASLRTGFADILDDLRLSSEALMSWRRVLESQPGFGRAHYRIARLLFEAGDPSAAEQAAQTGIEVAPNSADLYMVKADALENQGRMYAARSTLEQGAAAVQDTVLLSRLAAVEDTYGVSAAGTYSRLADALGESSPERLPVLERGLAVSLRDGDFAHAESFAVLLGAAGHPEHRGLLGTEKHADSGTVVPGGLDALAFAAHAKQGVSPERFFAEYCRSLVNHDMNGTSVQYREEIRKHFQRVAALERFGKRIDNRMVITLSLNGKEARRNTESVLGILGIKLRSSKGEVGLARGEKKSDAKKQDTVSALAIDEVGIQEALQTGKPYTLEILYEWASVFPNDELWREAFYRKEEEPGGFAAALARMPKLDRLYAGISSLDRRTVAELLSAVPLQTLYERYAELLYHFAPALALEGSHAAVPGGPPAEAVWSRLAGVSPSQPGAFFRALLDRDNGRLLAFFFTLSNLDRQHQAFFVASDSRASQFYTLFAESDKLHQRPAGVIRDSAMVDFLRAVPLDGEGHINFPGSAEIWAGAKGHSSNSAQASKLLKKASRSASRDVEDAVLSRLVQTRYTDKSGRRSEMENFLAVARIDAHRADRLDEESALLLAQRYGDYSAAYAYFSDLTALGAAEFRQFFAAVDRIKSHSPRDANLQLGQFHGLIGWICLLKRRRAISDSDATRLFRELCDHLSSAGDPAAMVSASLSSARDILASCKVQVRSGLADEKIRSCMLGPEVESNRRRITEFQRIMDAQKVPGLEDLFSIYDAATKLVARPSSSGELLAIQKAVANLPLVAIPKEIKIEGREKENLVAYDPAPIRKVVEQLNEKLAKGNANGADVQRLARQLIAVLGPQVTAAFSGPLYACFLRPSDLVATEDALLLRKHRYFEIASSFDHTARIEASSFTAASAGAGSYFAGGFAQFPLAAGDAASKRWKIAGEAASDVAAAQIAAIRGAAWEQIEESDQRLVGLRIKVAREWIFEAARQYKELHTLSEETMGLLSLARRADLLNGIESRNWHTVWESITLPDLFALGGRYLERHKSQDGWLSPATAGLRALAAVNNGSRLRALGAIRYRAFGCSHPDLIVDAPYEEYERYQFPVDMAERAAEFKLFLAFQADSLGIEPATLANVAEALTEKAFRHAQLANFRDWRSLMAAYGSIGASDMKEVLQ